MSEQATAAEQTTMPKHGEFCWTEISTPDLGACRSFYEEIFGWVFQKSENSDIEMEYLEFGLRGTDSPESGRGGMYEMKEGMGEGETAPPHFMNYVAVDDVDESAGKAFDLGGKIVVPPMDIPNVGRFCVVQDPTGASISMITLKR